MDEILYLEPDEEITSVVDKLKGLEADSVGLVAPKGSSIVQSLVSLKLLQKQAKELGKKIAIITSDEVGQNLASRIELPVYADVRSKKPIEPIMQEEPSQSGPIEITDTPAVAEAEELAEKKTPKVPEKPDTKKELPEEYKDLPKSFEIHRYDEPTTVHGQQEDEELGSAPASSDGQKEDEESADHLADNDSDKPEEVSEIKQEQEGTMKSENDDKPKFINRPLSRRREENRVELEFARPIIHEKKQVINLKKENRKKAVLAAVGVVLLLLAVLLADLTFAKLKIDLAIPAEAVTKEATVSVEKDHPNPDYTNAVINGNQIDKEVTQEGSYSATGDKETGEKAKGTLTIQNELGTDVSLAQGATVKSSGGISFTLDQAVTVPKASLDAAGNKVLGRATGAVTAATAGASGNLAANTSYAVEGKTGISLTGETKGGTTKKVKVVTKGDIDSAKKDILAKATDKFKTDTKSDQDVILLDDAFTAETASFTTTKNAGDEADTFMATAKVRVVTLTFSKKDFTQAVIKAAEKDLPEGKSLLVTDKDQVDPVLDENQLNIGKLKVKGRLSSHIGPKIDLEKLISGFKFKPIKKIKSEVEAIPGATVKEVKITPNYALPLGPILKSNTQINIEYTNK